MATSHLNEVVQHLRRAVQRQDGAAATDGQLLGQFIEHRDGAAFAALVKRHGPMVWSVCRRVLRDHHNAEDAFQAAFLVLVRKAVVVVPREMVANWLYGVAHQTALKARALAARRKGRERQVTDMPEPAAADPDLWPDLQPLLDRELSRLPDKYRIAVVLCDLEGKTRKEVARQLALPEGTVASRLGRARAMLARRLARHGLPVTAGALAVLLPRSAATAGAPTALVSATVKIGSLGAAEAVSVRVAALTEGVVKSMLLTKLNALTTVLLTATLLAGGSVLLGGSPRGLAPQEDRHPALARVALPGTAAFTDRDQLQGTWVAVAAELDGRKLSKDEYEPWGKLVFAGETVARGARKPRAGTYQFVPGTGPKRIDLNIGEGPVAGIYELNGASLKLVWKLGPERPTAINSRQAFSIVYEKQAEDTAADDPKTGKAPSDKEVLQGTWIAKSGEKNGEKLNEFQLKMWEKLIFDGDKITREGSEKREMTYKLDPSATPKEIEVVWGGQTFQGIYELKGKTLKLMIKLNGQPTEFNSKGGILLVFEKEKK